MSLIWESPDPTPEELMALDEQLSRAEHFPPSLPMPSFRRQELKYDTSDYVLAVILAVSVSLAIYAFSEGPGAAFVRAIL